MGSEMCIRDRAGTASASKALIVDSNKDIAALRNVSLTGELDAATLDISGNADIDGTTNLDAVDIDGATQMDGTVTVGVDDTGYDVKFFGDSAGAYMEWDASADQLRIVGASADATTSTGKLLLATALNDINANDVIGKIEWQAPLEVGADAISVSASIKAIAQSTFTSTSNATDLIFSTGHSETATEKFRITSQGELGVGGANYGTDGQVLTSGGAGAAPAWEDAAGGGHTIQEEGSSLTQRTNLNFVGAGVTATDDSGNNATKVTVTPTGASLPVTRSDGSTSDPIALTSAALGESLVSDTSPQLGGNLDVNGQSIVSASNGNIQITPNGTGSVLVGVNDTGHDVKFFGATSGKYMEWDESADSLNVVGTANAKMLNLSASGAALASQNAHKIILVDLTDPSTMWDVEAFLARARYTSWYQESGVGAPPMRGAIWINNAQTTVIWWNLDTDALYLSFTGAANANVLKGTAISDIAFLDGILYASSAHGITRIDFLRDGSDNFGTYGHMTNFKDIENRNVTQAWTVLRTTPALVSDTVNGVAAVRDPSAVDEFDRPKHWWAVATGGGMSVYNPINDAIYDGSSTDAMLSVGVAPDGTLSYARNYSGDDIATIRSSIYTISADGWTRDYYWYESGSNGAILPASASVVLNDMRPFVGGPQSRMAALGSDEGLFIFVLNESSSTANIAEESGVIKITSTYQTPYMKGARAGAYPLNDVTDRSGKGNDLTNNNSTTFSSGVFGNAATFNGTDQYLSRTGDDDFNCGTGDFTISFYIKSTSASNPSGVEIPFSLFRGDSTDYLQFRFDTDGTADVQVSDDSGSSVDSINGSGDLYDAKWHHIAIVRDSTTLKLYQDGVLSGSGTLTNAAGSLDFQQVNVGADRGNNEFAGQMAQLSIGKAAWTENEINLEYQRMVRGLGGATATLANSDVKSVRIDQDSGLAAITTAANQTEIWDVTTGLRESIDATTTATINDADLALKSGADDPEYLSLIHI